MNALNLTNKFGIKPKGCPFCGSEDLMMRGEAVVWLFCDGCETEGPWGTTESQSIERWNVRHEETPSIERCMK